MRKDFGVSQIVLGIGTSHSPLLTFDAITWKERAADDLRNAELTLSDGRTLTYAALLEETEGRYVKEATLERFGQQVRDASNAMNRLAAEIASAAPDVVVVIGDDQGELFALGNMPAVSVYYGDALIMHPMTVDERSPQWLASAIRGYGMDLPHRYPAAPQLARSLIDGLLDRSVDVGAAAQIDDPQLAGFGHAFGFIIKRLFGAREIPVLPVLLNTYYPPNVPRSRRCYDIGKAICSTLESIKNVQRIAVVASGGLSHFVTDEQLDKSVLQALKSDDQDQLSAISPLALRAGSSEILCWIMAGGVLSNLRQIWSEYIPVYRTPAGTGIGLAFAAWRPPS
jgi:hypothetical protein